MRIQQVDYVNVSGEYRYGYDTPERTVNMWDDIDKLIIGRGWIMNDFFDKGIMHAEFLSFKDFVIQSNTELPFDCPVKFQITCHGNKAQIWAYYAMELLGQFIIYKAVTKYGAALHDGDDIRELLIPEP